MPDQPLSRRSNSHVTVEGKWNLRIGEIWPDGDAPVNPTAQDVADKMAKDCGGSIWELMRSWNMEPDTVWVDSLKADLR